MNPTLYRVYETVVCGEVDFWPEAGGIDLSGSEGPLIRLTSLPSANPVTQWLNPPIRLGSSPTFVNSIEALLALFIIKYVYRIFWIPGQNPKPKIPKSKFPEFNFSKTSGCPTALPAKPSPSLFKSSHRISKRAIHPHTTTPQTLLRLGYFSTSWKYAIVIMAPKPSKTKSNSKGYRPISSADMCPSYQK